MSDEIVEIIHGTLVAKGLVSEIVYTFVLSVHPESAPGNVAYDQVSIEVERAPLRVGIAGVNRQASVLQRLRLECDMSYNGVAGLSDFDFEWTRASILVDGGAGACQDATSGEFIAFEPTCRTVLPPDTLLGGTYTFSVTARDRVVVTIDMYDVYIPSVQIDVDTSITPIGATGQGNADTKIVINGMVYLPESLVDAVLKWTTSAEYLDVDSDTNAAPLGSSSAKFVLNVGFLSSRATVTFTLTTTAMDKVRSETVSSSASVKVVVNSPPTSGSCRRTPSIGHALSTSFAISCEGWQSETSADLYYEYQHVLESDVQIATATLLPRSYRRLQLQGVRSRGCAAANSSMPRGLCQYGIQTAVIANYGKVVSDPLRCIDGDVICDWRLLPHRFHANLGNVNGITGDRLQAVLGTGGRRRVAIWAAFVSRRS